jgi:hypothetical protein
VIENNHKSKSTFCHFELFYFLRVLEKEAAVEGGLGYCGEGKKKNKIEIKIEI